jgi:hypothetical protein
MKQLSLLGILGACFIALTAPRITWAAPISVTGSNVTTRASDDTGSIVEVTSTSTTIPTSETLTITEGNSSSTTVISYSGNANSTTFSWDAEISIDNSGGLSTPACCDFADSFNDFLFFTADVDATYSISGFYDHSGPVGTTVFFEAWLFDSGTYLFRDVSESRSTANEYFVLGDVGDGDYSNTNVGELTGNLIAGHSYTFFYQSWIQALDADDLETEVSAIGNSNVTLDISAIPVPASVFLFSSGFLGLIGFSRGIKKSAV